MSDDNSYGFGGKLIAAIILALLGGYGWACFDTGRSPLAILSLFGGKEEPEPVKAAPSPKPVPKPEPVAVKKTEPPKPVEAPVVKKTEPAPAPIGPRPYSAVDMSILFNETDDLLRRGKFFEARNKIANSSRLQVPQDSLTKFTEYELRVGKYHNLLLETTKGGTIEMPKMTRIVIKNGGKLIVKVLNETPDAVTYETLTGIRSRITKDRCEEIAPLEAVYARVEVNEELKKQARYKSLTLETDALKPLTVKDAPGKNASGLQIFDLADFCARNGANNHLLPLFDEALMRDPDLLVTVHETKADRMVEVLIYFLSINSASDARRTADLLKERYADTKSYKDRVQNDSDVNLAMDTVLKRFKPMAKLDKPAPPKPAPLPNKPDPAPETQKPDEPKPPDPTPDPVTQKPEPAEVVRNTDPEKPAEPTSVSMPDGTNQKISDLVKKGDKLYDEAMVHLRNSDPSINPDTWAEENKKALKLFMQANGECFMPAQDQYSGSVPGPLLDRVRETSMRTALCRKRSVSTRR
jgi:outer membrane biosynthesis protein TonB